MMMFLMGMASSVLIFEPLVSKETTVNTKVGTLWGIPSTVSGSERLCS